MSEQDTGCERPATRRSKITHAQKRRIFLTLGIEPRPGQYVLACYWCDVPMHITIAPGGRVYLGFTSSGHCTEVDHLIPVTRGGRNTAGNLVFVCQPCNASRGNRHWTPPRLSRLA